VVDQIIAILYNTYMLKKTTTRRRRQDTKHAVYCITNTVTGELYMGITVCGSQVNRALKIRMQKHVRRALTEGRDWSLCSSIREHGAAAHEMQLVELIRGRKPAHARERELIREIAPALNTH